MKRWSLIEGAGGYIEESVDGEFVDFYKHADMVADLEAKNNRLKEANKGLVGALEAIRDFHGGCECDCDSSPDHYGDECDCGAQEINIQVSKALSRAKEAQND